MSRSKVRALGAHSGNGRRNLYDRADPKTIQAIADVRAILPALAADPINYLR